MTPRAGPESAPRSPRRHPCHRWSAHAEDLALAVEGRLERWPDSPTTDRMVADGLLRPLGRGVHLPPGDELAMCERAVAIGCALGAELRAAHVIAGPSAAWVSLGGDPPGFLHLLTSARPTVLAEVRIREAQLRTADIEWIGGCPVTTPARTALDLLRFEAAAEAHHLVLGLIHTGHVREQEITARMRRLSAVPHVRLARERWEALLTQVAAIPSR